MDEPRWNPAWPGQGCIRARAHRGEQGRFGPGGRTARHRSSVYFLGTWAVARYLDALDAAHRRGGASECGDLASLELDFVAHAWEYGVARRIQPATWREAGVPESVLCRAGITA